MIGTLDDDSTATSPRALLDRPGPRGLIVADWAAATEQGRSRARNEDSWRQLGPIFALADGMGGLDDGNVASLAAVNAAVENWLAAEDRPPTDVAYAANDAVRASKAPDIESGSTLSALRIARDQATVVNVGDSRVYRIRGQHAELITRDHNLRAELLAAGISPQSGLPFGPLGALTSHLGMDPARLQIDVRSVTLHAGDRIILCSDGVHSMTHSQFMQRAIGADARSAAERLTTAGGHDDATVIVVDIGHVDTRSSER